MPDLNLEGMMAKKAKKAKKSKKKAAKTKAAPKKKGLIARMMGK